MKTIEYPRTVYVLSRNYNVRKVTLVRPYSQSYDSGGYTKGGQFHRERDIFSTAKAAIKSGRATLRRREKALMAGLELVAKQNAALDKAATSPAPSGTAGTQTGEQA